MSSSYQIDRLHPQKTKMAMESSSHLKVYLLLKMVIFNSAMSVFQGCFIQLGLEIQPFMTFATRYQPTPAIHICHWGKGPNSCSNMLSWRDKYLSFSKKCFEISKRQKKQQKRRLYKKMG